MKNACKAVGLLSGGLDSAIAARLIMDQGIEVHVATISMPWDCGKVSGAVKLAERLNIPCRVIPLGDDYLPLLTQPKYGIGSAHNPCVDCHIYMVKKAAALMQEIGASFVFTGEVLGQRPMSQRRECLEWVAKDGGIPGRLLRPLSAKLLDVTIPEQEGLVDREKLLGISGRSRKTQYQLAKEWGIKGFATPSGGCLLTEKLFGLRLKDVLKRGCPDIASTAVLGLGKYFRLDEGAFVILGRDNDENEKLIRYARPMDIIIRPTTFPGPLALLRTRADLESPSGAKGDGISESPSPLWGGIKGGGMLAVAAGLSQFFSKSRDKDPLPLTFWRADDPSHTGQVIAARLEEHVIRNMQL